MSLTPKEEMFTQCLFKGLSQRQAYKEAYERSRKWTDNTVDSKACKLAKKDKVVARLKELQQEVANESKWSVEKLIQEFISVKEKCMQEVEVLDRFGNGTGEYVFKEQGAIKSLENIGKLLGHYTEKVEHSGEVKMPDIIIKK